MENIVLLYTNRSDYGAIPAAKNSITVGELIRELENYDEDSKVVFCNDNGYTYGHVGEIDEQMFKTDKEETMEELNDELLDLQAEYEHVPEYEDDEAMTEEEYRAARKELFDWYRVTEEEYENYCRN